LGNEVYENQGNELAYTSAFPHFDEFLNMLAGFTAPGSISLSHDKLSSKISLFSVRMRLEYG